MCGSCVSANETGTDCLDSCEFEYTWQRPASGGDEPQCLHIETKLEPEGCNGVPGMCLKCFSCLSNSIHNWSKINIPVPCLGGHVQMTSF